MLGNKDAVANIAVKNLQTARKFYEGTLGLKAVGTEGDELIAFRSGGSTLYVYRSRLRRHQQGDGRDLGRRRRSGRASCATLRAKGVAFEHYTMPGDEARGRRPRRRRR